MKLCAGTTYVVGFVKTVYTVEEGESSVEICVTLLSGDIESQTVINLEVTSVGVQEILPAGIFQASMFLRH